MNILITGGSRGIGRACVERFTRDGHTVAFLYRSNDKAANELAERTGAIAIQADVSDVSDVQAAICKASDTLWSIDVLVNNAGIAEFKLFTDISDADWERMISTNLSGAFLVTREIAKSMISQKHGRIINVGSMWGKVGASCEVHYSAAKAGLRGMTMALAKELGPSGITVNCVEPGVIDTDMNAMLDDNARAELCDATPLCRLGRADEVASLIAFLASDEAGFITGQCIGIDGGFAV
ncbi:MAG: 3-oxoacyl-ACP reductase FabG [Clostridia bacterium]|nr:3-oxoacyl-ACP reductase FabG [Clostridia bacterium]